MEKVQRISLEKRLQLVGTNKPNFLAVFEIFLDDYFQGLTRMSGNPYFREVYQNEICKDTSCMQMDILLAEMPHITDEYPKEEGLECLYKILVEPFALIRDGKKEERKYESVLENS